MLLKKHIQLFIFFFVVLLLQACAINDKQQKQWIDTGHSFLNTLSKRSLTEKDIADGLKEALSIGADRVVSRVGRKNGYLKDKAISIALPENLKKVHNTLDQIGLGQYTKELEVKMNRAAEIAAPKAKKLFITAIKFLLFIDTVPTIPYPPSVVYPVFIPVAPS